MALGNTAADLIIVLDFTKKLYRSLKSASSEYISLSQEVRGLHTVLRHLKYELAAPESLLNADRGLYAKDLAPIVQACYDTLQELDKTVRKYQGLRDGGLYDRAKFGTQELDKLADIRIKLINHKTTISLLLDQVQLRSSAQVKQTLSNQGGQLERILDKVDNIAARMGQRAGSIMTTYDDDDKEVWKAFRRELVAEGFSSDVLSQHKDVLRAYIRQIDQNGLLDEVGPGARGTQPALSLNTQAWLSNLEPPPISPNHSPESANSSVKEMAPLEENLKFPQSLKPERAGGNFSLREPPLLAHSSSSTSPVNSTRMEELALVLRKQIPEPEFCSTAMILADDRASEASSSLSLAPLAISNQNRSRRMSSDTASPMAGSPAANGSYAAHQRVPNSNRDSGVSLFGSSPQRHSSNMPLDPGRFGSSPRTSRSSLPSLDSGPTLTSTASSLAPDQKGNPIPENAAWTRVKRDLVSLAVLHRAGYRFEARPEYVAILGRLTRQDLQDLAVQSALEREARRRSNGSSAGRPVSRGGPGDGGEKGADRPLKGILKKGEKNVHFSASTSGESTGTGTDPESSQSDSEAVRREQRQKRQASLYREEDRERDRERYAQPRRGEGGRRDRERERDRERYDRDRDRERDRKAHAYAVYAAERAGDSRGLPIPHPNSHLGPMSPAVGSGGYRLPDSDLYGTSPGKRDGSRGDARGNGGREADRRHGNGRWSERLTAASIGGAAASLLSVLTEAAVDMAI